MFPEPGKLASPVTGNRVGESFTARRVQFCPAADFLVPVLITLRLSSLLLFELFKYLQISSKRNGLYHLRISFSLFSMKIDQNPVEKQYMSNKITINEIRCCSLSIRSIVIINIRKLFWYEQCRAIFDLLVKMTSCKNKNDVKVQCIKPRSKTMFYTLRQSIDKVYPI